MIQGIRNIPPLTFKIDTGGKARLRTKEPL